MPILPVNIMFYQERMQIVKDMVQIIIAPFGIVRFRHFFVADLFCSLTWPLGFLTETMCFLLTGIFQNDINATCPNLSYLMLIVSLAPFTIRFLQCLRKYHDTKMKFPHLVNATKYVSSIVALFVTFKYKLNSEQWFTAYWFQMWATLFSLIWDFRMDWGVLRSINKKLALWSRWMYPDNFYYTAMFVNMCLWMTWLSLLPGPFEKISSLIGYSTFSFILAMLEAFRRSMWAIFRVENENVNNFEGYRQFDIPKMRSYKLSKYID